jgi:hypothetical protein
MAIQVSGVVVFGLQLRAMLDVSEWWEVGVAWQTDKQMQSVDSAADAADNSTCNLNDSSEVES